MLEGGAEKTRSETQLAFCSLYFSVMAFSNYRNNKSVQKVSDCWQEKKWRRVIDGSGGFHMRCSPYHFPSRSGAKYVKQWNHLFFIEIPFSA